MSKGGEREGEKEKKKGREKKGSKKCLRKIYSIVIVSYFRYGYLNILWQYLSKAHVIK